MANKELLGKLADAGVISPGDAVRMSDYQPAGKPARRSYEAAQLSNLTSSWTTVPRPADFDIRWELRRLRARARHEAKNNDYVIRFLTLVKSNVVGHAGISMIPQIIDPFGKPDPLADQAISDGWKDWGKKGSADVTGQLSWKMIQRMYIANMARDGEVLIRKVKGWKGNKYRFALQFLDPELLDVFYNTYNPSGNNIRMGVELNEWRQPVAYHLLTTSPTAFDYMYMGRRYIRVPADQIYHHYLPDWIWATRGVPWVAAGLLRLNMLHGYEEAELVASRAGAAKFAVYEKTDPESPVMDPTQEFEQQQDGSGKFVEDFDSGTISVAPEGYKMNLINPTHPNAAYSDFVKGCLRGISAGLGTSYHSLSNDLEGANYSSLRQGSLDDRDLWMMLQDFMIEGFCTEVYNDWLPPALLSKTMTVVGKPLKVNREEIYKRVVWQGRRWKWVDPQKEVTAQATEINLRIRSPQSIIRERGDDPDMVLKEIDEWNKQLDKLGIPPAQASAPAAQPAQPQSTDTTSTDSGDTSNAQDNQA